MDIATLGLEIRSDGVVVANKRLRETERQSKRTEKASHRLENQAQKTEKSFERYAATMRKAAAVTAAVAAAGGFALKQFADFETALVGIAKVTDLSSQEVQKMGQRIRQMSTQMPFAATELAALAEAAGRLGVTGSADILKFTETVSKLGTASDISGEEAATALARILNVSQEANSNVDVLASTIVALGNSFAASESEITQMTTEIARGVSTFDVASEKSAALAGVLASLGVRMQEAGSGVGRTFRSIEKAIGEGGEEFERLQEITRMTGEQLQITFEEDSVAVFQAFIEGLQRVQENGGRVAGVLDEFGLAGERIAKVIPVLAGRSDELARALRTAADEAEDATALEDEYQRALDTTGTELTLLKNTLIEQARVLGGTLAPSVRRASESIREFITAVQDGKEEVSGFTEGVKDGVFALKEFLALGGDFQNFQLGADPDEAWLDLGDLLEQTNDFINTVNPAVVAGNKFTGMLREARIEAEESASGLQTFAGLVSNIAQGVRSEMVPELQKFVGSQTDLMAVVGNVTRALDEQRKANEKVTEAWKEATEEGEALTEELTNELAMWGMNEAEALRFEAALVELNDTYGDASDEVADLLRGKADLVEADNDAADAADREADAQDRLNQRLSEQQSLLDRLNPAAARRAQFNQDTGTLLDATGNAGADALGMGDFVTGVSQFGEFVDNFARLTRELDADTSGGGDGGLFDSSMGQEQAIQQASQVAAGAVGQALGIEQGGLGSALGGIAGSFIGGPIGSAIGSLLGGVVDGIFGSGSPDFPTFNVQSSQPSLSDLDQSRQTPFGGVATGDVFNVDAGQISQILDAIVAFDRDMAQMFDPSDFDAITASLEAFDETFKESGASAEEVMRRRFIAALNAAEPEIASFVESFGSLEEMQGALAGIEAIRDSLDDFSNVLLAMGDPVDQLTARLNRAQQGIEAADTAMEQALFSEDPQAIAQAGQDLQQAILEKFELEKRLIEDLQDQLRNLELSGRQFDLSIAERLADLEGGRAVGAFARQANQNRQAAQQDVLNADDTQEALRNLDRFVDSVDTWLDAARRRVTELRDMELERINNQISVLEDEANEILARGRERSQAAQQASQRAAQAAQRARQAELEAINEQLEQAREWQSVLDATRQMIDNLTFSQTNPASRFSRLDMLNERIQGQDTSTPEGAREMQQLLQRRLDLGQQLFQRGSSEFESLFNDTMRLLSNIEDKAQSEAEIANELQERANALQSQTTSAISSSTGTNIRLSSAEQQRLEEIRDEQERLEAEAQEVRENAEAALGRIDENAARYYTWAQNQRETLEQQRQQELVNRLDAITGGLDPQSYIAQRQDDVVDRLTTIRDSLADFLEAISGSGSGDGVNPGGGDPVDPRNPNIPASATNNITINVTSSGTSTKDARRIATVINRELKTA